MMIKRTKGKKNRKYPNAKSSRRGTSLPSQDPLPKNTLFEALPPWMKRSPKPSCSAPSPSRSPQTPNLTNKENIDQKTMMRVPVMLARVIPFLHPPRELHSMPIRSLSSIYLVLYFGLTKLWVTQSLLQFSYLTFMEAACVPLALAGRDICGSAITGSGKTAAFALPILERLLFRPKRVPAIRVLVLTPTRELAVQVHSMIQKIAQFTDIRCCLVVGGLSTKMQVAALQSMPDIVVATPGRMIDHLRNSMAVDLDDLAVLILDEADRLLELGFSAEISELAKRAGSKLKSRIVAEWSIIKWSQRIEQMEDGVAFILLEEREEMALRKAERFYSLSSSLQDNYEAENMIAHKDEIFSRPKKTWFVTEKEKRVVAKAAKASTAKDKGSAKDVISAQEAEDLRMKEKRKRQREKNLPRRKRRKLEAAREMLEEVDKSQEGAGKNTKEKAGLSLVDLASRWAKAVKAVKKAQDAGKIIKKCIKKQKSNSQRTQSRTEEMQELFQSDKQQKRIRSGGMRRKKSKNSFKSKSRSKRK